jgi:site-specific recombinase XerD
MSLVEWEPKEVVLAEVADQARGYAAASRSEATRRAYRADWDHFATWCDGRGLSSLPADPTTVALYVTYMADTYKPSTISRRLVSIAQAHKAAGHPSPTTDERVRLVNAGIRRVHGVATRQVRPVVTEDLRRMVDTCGLDPAGVRDRALLLLGFAAALRRSELVALDTGDVEETHDGLVVTVRRSKTDQEGAGRKIGVPFGSNPSTCPVRAWRAWVGEAEVTEGPLFRGIDRHGNIAASRLSDRAVALIVKRRAEAAGIDPATVSGHSLRAGLATSAAAAGVSERAIAATTGHKSMAVLRGYIRDGSLFTENAAAAVGL